MYKYKPSKLRKFISFKGNDSGSSTQKSKSSEVVSRSFQSMETAVPPPLAPKRGKNETLPDEIFLPEMDYMIRAIGGSTSETDRLRAEMKRSKHRRVQRDEEIIELKRDIGSLRAEVAYFRDVKGYLMELYTSVVKMNKEMLRIQNMLQHSIEHCSEGIGQAEEQYLNYWDIKMNRGHEEGGFI